ncbi:LacI family DNA-binding transcriptional regulator [Paenibacillus sp. JCM 10914]|uniref:LacI family DNA-binding transcriptional regulator n=1 Tax=Paenibacillus sp. JCM 10914 TaxID=1236974 RepID=UPI0003CC80EF|nr:LacI family DNA-binding transcriptional regulator [Paenibacillus sp. JCM 10914]GAE06132.1 ribose operon repressor [Paenibacillus sp. JCM 10914]
MKKPTTIHDIAKMANVSSATVSRVLSNSSYPVSKELKERIQRIAKESNYIPNMLGKQLKKNSSNTIGVIIPSIVNPFYSSVIFGIEEVARQNSFTVIVCNSLQDPALEDEYLRTIMEKQVKGLIISSISKDKSQLTQLMQLGLNVIAIDQKIEEDNINQIEFDYHKAGYMATKHLQEKGHEHIGYVTSKMDRPSRRSIHQGYMSAMKDASLKPLVVESHTEEVYNAITEFDTGKQLTRKLLQQSPRPTAIFACNDMMAFGVINELSEQHIAVPQEISVMGFDGIDVGQMIHPPLTTIKQPDYEMGKMACKMLLDMMNGEDGPMFDVMLQPKLLERQSIRDIRSAIE